MAAAISIANVVFPLPDGPPIKNACGAVSDSMALPTLVFVSSLPRSLGK
jgi:hypothetical protein